MTFVGMRAISIFAFQLSIQFSKVIFIRFLMNRKLNQILYAGMCRHEHEQQDLDFVIQCAAIVPITLFFFTKYYPWKSEGIWI